MGKHMKVSRNLARSFEAVRLELEAEYEELVNVWDQRPETYQDSEAGETASEWLDVLSDIIDQMKEFTESPAS